jgi:hypothetical protein
MAFSSFALGFLLAVLAAARLVSAQESASVVFVAEGGAVCVGGGDVMWADANNRIIRWHRRNGVLSEVAVPASDLVDLSREVVGCLVRPDGTIDLYYVEGYSIPGIRTDLGGLARSGRTVWTSGGRHRVLQDFGILDTGVVGPKVQIVPELGVVVHDDVVVERASDGATYKIELPKDMQVYGAWPASRRWPVDPSELVVCYGYSGRYKGARQEAAGCFALLVEETPMKQRPLQADTRDTNLMAQMYAPDNEPVRLCALRPPADGVYPLRRATFDCFHNIFIQGQYRLRYAVDNGIVVWRRRLPDSLCRQRSVDIDGLVVQAQCFRIEGMKFLPATNIAVDLATGYEYPATSGWTATFVGREANPPVTVPLLSSND